MTLPLMVQACHVVIAALRRGYLESALRLCAVLIQQQDTDVLLETTQGMTEVGGSKEAEELKQALTGAIRARPTMCAGSRDKDTGL